MASYLIFKHMASGRLFRVARRVTKMPGRVDARDWVKMPCTESGMPDWTGPQFLLASTATTRLAVEQELMDLTNAGERINVVYKEVML
jgi:hypothetical protein